MDKIAEWKDFDIGIEEVMTRYGSYKELVIEDDKIKVTIRESSKVEIWPKKEKAE